MKTIIYFHGFGSVGTSPKSIALRQAFPDYDVHSPDLPDSPTDVIQLVDHIINSATKFPIVLVGTSLGGFWANYFAQRFDMGCILVNPSTRPDISMPPRIGQELKNYSNGNPICITQTIVEQYTACVNELAKNYDGSLVHLFIAEDDDLLNPQWAIDNLPNPKSIMITGDGGHRFDTNWHLIINKLNSME